MRHWRANYGSKVKPGLRRSSDLQTDWEIDVSKKKWLAGVWGFLGLSLSYAVTPEWPKLLGGKNVPECTTALHYAQAAYQSKVPRIADYREGPADLDSALAPVDDRTIFTQVDSSSFDVIDQEKWGSTRGVDPQRRTYTVFWQTNTNTRTRLVFTVSFLHGAEVYGVDLIPASWSPAQYDEVAQHRTSGDKIGQAVPGSYLQHLVFQRKDNAALWLIHVGETYDFLPNWRVYVGVADRYQETCQIQFRPPANHASLLLPPAVQQLDRLMLRSMGERPWGRDGTPSGYPEISGNIAWANAALRPWAMGTLWQTREEVDAGLLAWSKQGPAYQAEYSALMTQYVIAEKALAGYYKKRFHMPPDQAQVTAKDALDVAFRSHYWF